MSTHPLVSQQRFKGIPGHIANQNSRYSRQWDSSPGPKTTNSPRAFMRKHEHARLPSGPTRQTRSQPKLSTESPRHKYRKRERIVFDDQSIVQLSHGTGRLGQALFKHSHQKWMRGKEQPAYTFCLCLSFLPASNKPPVPFRDLA